MTPLPVLDPKKEMKKKLVSKMKMLVSQDKNVVQTSKLSQDNVAQVRERAKLRQEAVRKMGE